MQRQKNNMAILQDNSELLQKLPEILSKHVEIYENIHKDIDASDHNSNLHFRSTHDNNQSYLKQLIGTSNDFVEAITKLKNNFITLASKYTGNKDGKEKLRLEGGEARKISNFNLFVSEQCRQGTQELLKLSCQPLIRDEEFNYFFD